MPVSLKLIKKKKKIKEGGTFPNLIYKDSITLKNKAR